MTVKYYFRNYEYLNKSALVYSCTLNILEVSHPGHLVIFALV